MRKLFFAGRVAGVRARARLRLLLAGIRLHRTHDRLPARFNVDIPDVHSAWTISLNTLLRINELRYHRRTL
jgi:hypothetical protein